MRQRTNLVRLVTLALVAAACGGGTATESPTTTEAASSPASADPVRIGAIFPLSGAAARNGQASFEGAEIAVSMFNERGGACGRPVELVVQDAPEPADATAAANTLIDSDAVPAIITDTSAIALAVASVAERAQVVMWETEAIAGPLTGQGYEYVFRPPFSAGQMVASMVEFTATDVASALGKDASDVTVAIINIDTGFGTSTAAGFKAAAEVARMQIVLEEAYPADATDLSSLILSVKIADPDVLLAASFIGDAILWHDQSVEQDYEPRLMLGTTAAQGTADYLKAVGDDVNGIVVGGIPSKVAEENVSDELRDIFSEVLDRSGGDPDVLVLNGFDMTWVLLNEVLTKACEGEVTSDGIRNAILSLDMPEGSTILGYGMKFAPSDHPQSGQNLRAVAPVMQWQDESLEIIAPESVATSDFVAP